jgi:hypothetical protein
LRLLLGGALGLRLLGPSLLLRRRTKLRLGAELLLRDRLTRLTRLTWLRLRPDAEEPLEEALGRCGRGRGQQQGGDG